MPDESGEPGGAAPVLFQLSGGAKPRLTSTGVAATIIDQFFLSIGRPSFSHNWKPPSNAAASRKPFFLRSTTAPADVCSFGQEQ
jgi:hypothetical protein